ncbi:hypothetical protein GCM10012278_18530 [Nonomuraea glycinis]|uniref:Uncharacterized protein n=1 Tax=Nonomuraea glycinis TaxID=2047744 RepID=A0A918A1I5_9ACTN|nr:hypothetical protein GCM10012278_18530 [Nonomuraea glycinis]
MDGDPPRRHAARSVGGEGIRGEAGPQHNGVRQRVAGGDTELERVVRETVALWRRCPGGVAEGTGAEEYGGRAGAAEKAAPAEGTSERRTHGGVSFEDHG